MCLLVRGLNIRISHNYSYSTSGKSRRTKEPEICVS